MTEQITIAGESFTEKDREQAAKEFQEILSDRERWKDRALVAEQKLQQAIQERDQAIAEANRRDQKWMDGINECLGEKLDYDDPNSENCASLVLDDWANKQRAKLQQTEAACAEMRGAVKFPKITSSSARSLAFHVSKGDSFGGITDAALSLWLNSIADQMERLDHALSTDCGKLLLEKLRVMSEALEYCADYPKHGSFSFVEKSKQALAVAKET